VGYALSQRNNHAVSELCFQLSLKSADRTLSRLLRECITDQFYADGSYSQQSPTYQRLAVHTLVWLRVTAQLDDSTMRAIDDAIAASATYLARIVDPVSGFAPNYGPNDGALLLDLDARARGDFGPLLDLLGHGDGTSETVAWLGQRGDRPGAVSAESTYITLTRGTVHTLIRCGLGRHRLSHDDQLAIDVWIDGQNVAPDPGTFRYTAPAPWRNALTSAEAHSRPRAGTPPRRVGRFLTVPPEGATVLSRSDSAGVAGVAMSQRSGEGSCVRVVTVDALGVTVVDVAVMVDHISRINTALGTEALVTVRGAPVTTRRASESDPTSGWQSTSYADRRPAAALEADLMPGQPLVTTAGRPSPQRQAAAIALAADVVPPRDLAMLRDLGD
jgi:hypothetical protein